MTLSKMNISINICKYVGNQFLGFCCMVIYMCMSFKILVRYMYINSPKTKCIKTSKLSLYLSDHIWKKNLVCILQRQPLYDSDTSYMYTLRIL